MVLFCTWTSKATGETESKVGDRGGLEWYDLVVLSLHLLGKKPTSESDILQATCDCGILIVLYVHPSYGGSQKFAFHGSK